MTETIGESVPDTGGAMTWASRILGSGQEMISKASQFESQIRVGP